MLIEETPIADAVLPVGEFKAHLRLGSGFDPETVQDPVLTSFLRAAVVAVEGRTGKALFNRSFSVQVTAWRDPGSFDLPVAPVTQITSVEQVTREGLRTEASSTQWWLAEDTQAPKLRASGSALPAVPARGGVVISFDAGYATSWDGVPADLRQAVMLLAAHYYEYRHDTGLSEGCMPFGVSSLIERYKMVRLGTGGAR